VPTVFEFGGDYVDLIFKKGEDAIFLFSEDRDADYHKVFEQVARDHKGMLHFTTTGVSEGIQEKLA